MMKLTGVHIAIIAAVILFFMYYSKSMEKFDVPLHPFRSIKKERFTMPRAGYPYHAETPNYQLHARTFRNAR
jgi:hypothetical protein